MIEQIVKTENAAKIDLLSRQEFVNQILQIANNITKNKKNACYAINGAWGTGKSFVLDMFEEQAKDIGQEGTTLPKFLIFRYNCWEYDYYEEPVVAIAAAMLDAIEEKENLLPEEVKNTVKEMAKVIGKEFAKKLGTFVEDKTGIPVNMMVDVAKDGVSAANAKHTQDHEFDQYFTFKKMLKELRKSIASLAELQCVIFVVDELDRCLPPYAITVLERLHHLFDSIPNTQVILSIDKKQLEHSVCQIYGEKTNVDKYLSKFIDFVIFLDKGSFTEQGKFDLKFKDYVQQFDSGDLTEKSKDIEEFICTVFDGLDMRSRIAVLDKSLLLHELLTTSEGAADATLMCVELLLLVAKQTGVDFENSLDRFSIRNIFLMKNDADVPIGLRKINEKYQKFEGDENYYYTHTSGGRHLIDCSDLWGCLLAAYRAALGATKDSLSYQHEYIVQHARSFASQMNIIC